MKKKPLVLVTAIEEKQKELWKDDGKNLLCAELSYLNLVSSKLTASTKRINRYYLHMNRQIIRYCKNCLLPQVIKVYKATKESGETYSETKLYSKARLTYNDNGVLSIYTDIIENSGFGSITVRFSDVWNLTTGCPLPLSSFFPKNNNYKKFIKNFTIREISRLKDRDLGMYFDNVRKNCSKHFSPDNFFLTNDGLVVFYPMYSIAPRVEGIPTFTLKWSDDGPCKPLSLL